MENNYFKITRDEAKTSVYFRGNFYLSQAENYNSQELKTTIAKSKKVAFNFSDVVNYDSFLVTFLKIHENDLKKQNIELEIIFGNKEIENFYKYLTTYKQNIFDEKAEKKYYFGYFTERIGNIIIQIFRDGAGFITFIGDVIKGLLQILYRPKKIRWEDFPFQFFQVGVNAVPISLLIVFLIGLITGYQGALQLKDFGADIFIADLISISITRELAPLMVAIIVAGRSGSAFTAEIGTMKVSEEIDALKVMGFSITDFIVMPRLTAVLLAMPFIVILADLVGILGGLIAGLTTLDITIASYFNRMQIALSMSDIISGLIKSEIFAFFIAIIGCFRGLQVSGGAESVGRYTTSSVVTAIFHIILIDAVFTLLFPILGI